MCLFRTEYLPDWLKETESSFVEQPRRALGAQRKELSRRQQGQHQVALPRKVEEVAWVDATGPGGYLLAPLTRDHVLPLLSDA